MEYLNSVTCLSAANVYILVVNSLSVVYQALHSDNFCLHYCYSLEKQQNLWCNVYVLVSYMINEVKQVVLLVLHLESNHRKRKNNTEKNPCKVNVYVCISLWRAKNVIENSASSLSEYCFDRVLLFWHWNNIACLFQCSRDVNHHWITSRIVSNSAFFFFKEVLVRYFIPKFSSVASCSI